MDRRRFFRALTGASATASVAVTAKAQHSSPLPHELQLQGADYFDHRGYFDEHFYRFRSQLGDYNIHFTGWKGNAASAELAAQVLAYPRVHGIPNLYVSYPGLEGPFYEGETFCLLRHLDKQPLVTLATPHQVLWETEHEMDWRMRSLIARYRWKEYHKLGWPDAVDWREKLKKW